MAAVLFLLRFYQLGDLPPGIQSDDGADGVYALEVLRGNYAIYFPEKGSGREAVGVYALALSTALLGRTLLAFQLPVALASAATVYAVFWLGRLLSERDGEQDGESFWRGLLVGGVAAGVLATSVGQTFVSRAGLKAVYLPLFLTLGVSLLWLGWKRRNLPLVALAGACTGILPYIYYAGRVAPILVPLFGASFLAPPLTMAAASLRRSLKPGIVFLASAALVAGPIVFYSYLHQDEFFHRARALWIFAEGQEDPLGSYLKNLWDYLLLLGYHGDRHPRYNFAGMPLLSLPEAFFFWVGAGAAVWKWRQRPAYRLLLIWTALLILPATFSVDRTYSGPNLLRTVGAVPSISLLVGFGLWETVQFARSQLHRSPRLRGTNPAARGRAATVALALAISALLLGQGARSYRIFFKKWANSPEFHRAYHAEWAQAAQALSSLPPQVGAVNVLPYPVGNEHFNDEHFGFDYLYTGTAPAYVVAANTPDGLAKEIESALRAEGEVAALRYVDWNNDLVGGDPRSDDHLLLLLDKYARHLRSDAYERFQLHVYDNIDLNRSWTLYRRLEPLEVHYDAGISLQGVALGQGNQQIRPQDLYPVVMEEALWAAMQWRTAPGVENSFSISIRLHDVEGANVYQSDHVLWDRQGRSTNEWTAGEPVDTLFYLALPPDLAPGVYELRLVVYDFATAQPTVELGVWEPETVLARLHLGDTDG